MEAIEAHNDSLAGTLPKQQYNAITDDDILENLLKEFSTIPVDAEGDLFGRIYEYFLGKFALAEGQKGGQFFTPTSIVKLIVEIIEPYQGKIFDPACGSGGMFVQSAKFIRRHQSQTNQLSIYGQERTSDTVDLAKMNLAVNGLNGDIRNSNSYYEDPFEIDDFIDEAGHGPFDYVMANPPFNVKDVVEEKVTHSTRFNFYGLPAKASKPNSKSTKKQKLTTFGNANYLWANLFGSSLSPTGRAGFVMANSASDARSVELEVRKTIIEKDMVDVIIAISSNFFLSVTLPITLWFYDKGKPTERKNQTLFIDARNIYTQVSRAIRTFTQSQQYDLSSIVWLYRGEQGKYDELIQLYQSALNRWQQGKIENPFDRSLPYEGLEKANIALQQSLLTLQSTLNQWYTGIQAKLTASHNQVFETKRQTIDGEEIETPISFQQKLHADLPAELKEAYKILNQLTIFADKQLKIKKDKSFSTFQLKQLLKDATTLYQHQQTITKRIAYFENHLAWHEKRFAEGKYGDVEGLCKIASIEEIIEQNFSLNPGRYVGVALEEDNMTAEEFKEDMNDLHQRLMSLNSKASELEKLISENLNRVL